MSKYLGDYAAGGIIDFKFTTFRPSSGATFTFAGSPVISVYKDNSATQSTAGVTLTADFDSVAGLNHVRIDTSADAFYANGSSFECVITTGTVDTVSVVGSCVGRFTLRNQAYLYSTSPGRTLDVSTGGEAGLDWANVGSPTTTVGLTATTIATSQQITSVSGSVGSVGTGGITSSSFASGAIDSTAIATGAITSSELASSALGAIADAILARKLDSSGNETSTTASERTVRNALRVLRNKVDATSGTALNVYDEADTTIIWSMAIVTSSAAYPITKVG
jgi:hypothetical protein